MKYQVYVKTNDKRLIIAVNSSAFLDDLTGWTKIDEGSGDRYYHAQSGYFDKPIMDDRFVYRYAMDENDKPYERTQEEMDADYVESEVTPENNLNTEERIAALENQLVAYEAAYAEGVQSA